MSKYWDEQDSSAGQEAMEEQGRAVCHRRRSSGHIANFSGCPALVGLAVSESSPSSRSIPLSYQSLPPTVAHPFIHNQSPWYVVYDAHPLVTSLSTNY